MSIIDYGWDKYFEEKWTDISKNEVGLVPGRIIADYGQRVRIVTDEGELLVERASYRPGHMSPQEGFTAESQISAGDWVAIRKPSEIDGVHSDLVITHVLPRKTKFSRVASGIQLKEQIVAANVDVVFIIQSLNRDFNMRRLERYLIATWESGAMPVIILTKADCCECVGDRVAEAMHTAPGVEVIAISALTGEGLADVRKHIQPGRTVALLGSSGVGKSTLVNTLSGHEVLKTGEIREDDSRGRHTTTHREVVLLPQGGLVLDTPGMRTLALWEADTGMETLFGDIESLTKSCRFSDCRHEDEPGCAVRTAIEQGELAATRWESWLKLQKEQRFLEAKKDEKVRMYEKTWGRNIAKLKKSMKSIKKY